MKTYEQLTREQQGLAVENCLENLLKAIADGLRFNDEMNGDGLQATIDAANQAAEDNQTPWFWSSFVMESDAGPVLRSMAEVDAEDALYQCTDDPTVYPEPITDGRG